MRDSNQNDGVIIVFAVVVGLLLLGGGGFYTLRMRKQAMLAQREAMMQRDLAEAQAARALAAAEESMAANQRAEEMLAARSTAQSSEESPNTQMPQDAGESQNVESQSGESQSGESHSGESQATAEPPSTQAIDAAVESDLITFLAKRANAITNGDADTLFGLYDRTELPNVHWNGTMVDSWETLKIQLEELDLESIKFATGSVEIKTLGRDAAMMTVSSSSSQADADSAAGAITWVLRKIDGQWKILHESLATRVSAE
ncbi:MAG: nuclear transport factor 2 family protein [Planctomycetota bacterium]